jgi:oligopeptide/dipeptide ABC transporter ATP-binding protein
MMDKLLEVRNLVKHFPIVGSRAVVNAVNGVSFDVSPGETLALVGESGSGKTTVGRCIVRLTEVTAGSILFHGQDIARMPQSHFRKLRSKIQLVFQEPAESLDPRMSIGAAIAEPLLLQKHSAADRRRRVREIAALVGLSAVMLSMYPAELSAGQQQRVAIARALATDPEILVLDEPTSALDPTARAEIIDLLMRLQRELGIAYLFISHDLSIVRHVSKRVAVMYVGQIIEQGSTPEVFARQHHPYSVALLSAVLLPDPTIKRTVGITLKGEIPSPIDLPPGCYLASRCPLADDRCHGEAPPPVDVGHGHITRCFHRDRVAALQQEEHDPFVQFQRHAEELLRMRDVSVVAAGADGARQQSGAKSVEAQ